MANNLESRLGKCSVYETLMLQSYLFCSGMSPPRQMWLCLMQWGRPLRQSSLMLCAGTIKSTLIRPMKNLRK